VQRACRRGRRRRWRLDQGAGKGKGRGGRAGQGEGAYLSALGVRCERTRDTRRSARRRVRARGAVRAAARCASLCMFAGRAPGACGGAGAGRVLTTVAGQALGGSGRCIPPRLARGALHAVAVGISSCACRTRDTDICAAGFGAPVAGRAIARVGAALCPGLRLRPCCIQQQQPGHRDA